jgi:alkylhydroperoxidase family enzyme
MPEPRIRPREPGEVAGDVHGIFETYLRERGNIPNMFRTVAARPRHLQTLIAHFRTVMNEGDVPVLLKELIAVRVSAINRCRY